MNDHERDALLKTLEDRFEKYMGRHPALVWDTLRARLASRPDALRTLAEMERTGGEPDVTGYDAVSDQYVFCDCSAETPSGRRSLCYDREALNARKENKPSGCAVDAANAMGVELLTEAQYGALQTLGQFDRKTSSWIATPDAVRRLGGALFGDRRYDRVFTYHNGAESYYAARGFRGMLRV